MAFATDRDLLVVEPGLFRDVAWSAQKLVDVGGVSISGTTLTAGGADFVSAGVGAGHVALVNGSALEVVARLSATTLTVSKLRESAAGAAIPPAALTGATLVIATFVPQIRIVHEQVMRGLGIEPGVPGAGPGAPAVGADGRLGEASITNPGALTEVEALGALHLILSGAAALVSAESAMWAKAAAYRERFMEARRRAAALVDLDGDGLPDAARRVSAAWLQRG